MAILEEQVGNVAVHGEATCALGVDFCVITLEVYARKFFLSTSSVMVKWVVRTVLRWLRW